MDLLLYGVLFLACAGALYVAGEWIVMGLSHLSRVLGIREFTLAFFVMAAAASLPNLFVGVTSALEGIPELSLGDVFGNNIIAMTLAVAAGVLFSQKGYIETRSKTVRTSLLFMAVAAILPVILFADGVLGRVDGVALILFFLIYSRWLFAVEERFSKKYNGLNHHPKHFFAHAQRAFTNIFKIGLGVGILFLSALGIVSSASFFASHFGIPLIIIGILIVGLGNALPEVYFSVASARRGDTQLIMGNVMGSVIVPATVVLGVVALIRPIEIGSVEFLAENRLFLVAAALLVLLFSTTRKRITRVEAFILVLLYASFVMWTILTLR